ncbi:hypothetical protein [Raineyella fluvialis]|uniref:Tetratricopeptide repeat protein n=1 Tax=Raineyella fluvialis TaxID=2662261 RepID=A0A5Q2FKI6_9ACTN|nr:hypothetical protein [Raineyella fluvialis]QGF24856.1 hypothetical protein Rai3103_15890 [Raineyella fluvialis]
MSAHLVAAGDLVDDDPALALRHALAAKRRGARLPLVREAVAETAYAAEDFAVALTEYRALRRLSGDSAYLPVMADCERALGRPEEALRLVREAKLVDMTQRSKVELVIIEAGAREDLGQAKEGMRVLRTFLGRLSKDIPHEAHARLAYAYAAMLLRHDQPDEAREWFMIADELDTARELDAADQIELLDGVDFEFDFDEEDEDSDEDQDSEQAEDTADEGQLAAEAQQVDDVPEPTSATEAERTDVSEAQPQDVTPAQESDRPDVAPESVSDQTAETSSDSAAAEPGDNGVADE